MIIEDNSSKNFRFDRIFKLFLLYNIIASFFFGIVCLLIDSNLLETSPNAFAAVLIFMMLDVLNLFFSFLLTSFLTCCCVNICKSTTHKPAIFGCFPLIYKLGLYICYIALYPFCIIIFIEERQVEIEEITIVFLIYQMLVALAFLINGCSNMMKKETRSSYLLEAESMKSLYLIDDNEIELLQKEIEVSRANFKGSH